MIDKINKCTLSIYDVIAHPVNTSHSNSQARLPKLCVSTRSRITPGENPP